MIPNKQSRNEENILIYELADGPLLPHSQEQTSKQEKEYNFKLQCRKVTKQGMERKKINIKG